MPITQTFSFDLKVWEPNKFNSAHQHHSNHMDHIIWYGPCSMGHTIHVWYMYGPFDIPSVVMHIRLPNPVLVSAGCPMSSFATVRGNLFVESKDSCDIWKWWVHDEGELKVQGDLVQFMIFLNSSDTTGRLVRVNPGFISEIHCQAYSSVNQVSPWISTESVFEQNITNLFISMLSSTCVKV